MGERTWQKWMGLRVAVSAPSEHANARLNGSDGLLMHWYEESAHMVAVVYLLDGPNAGQDVKLPSKHLCYNANGFDDSPLWEWAYDECHDGGGPR